MFLLHLNLALISPLIVNEYCPINASEAVAVKSRVLPIVSDRR